MRLTIILMFRVSSPDKSWLNDSVPKNILWVVLAEARFQVEISLLNEVALKNDHAKSKTLLVSHPDTSL